MLSIGCKSVRCQYVFCLHIYNIVFFIFNGTFFAQPVCFSLFSYKNQSIWPEIFMRFFKVNKKALAGGFSGFKIFDFQAVEGEGL